MYFICGKAFVCNDVWLNTFYLCRNRIGQRKKAVFSPPDLFIIVENVVLHMCV